MVNYVFVRTLPAARNHCPCRNCSPWYRYAQANETGVKSQPICSESTQLFIHKSTDNSQGQQSTSAEMLFSAESTDVRIAGIHLYDALYPSTKSAMDPSLY